ncbi:MAG: hypothetical protein NTY41_10170 [Proteobacteria bacterium]|nr:hypothetical protein [Pseudomonadota bacterium]
MASITASGLGSSALDVNSIGSLTSTARFQSVKATPSDSSALSARASSTAASGTYSIDIVKLAHALSLAAAGETNTTEAIGSGT